MMEMQTTPSTARSTQDSMVQRAFTNFDESMQECIASCDETALICERLIQHCLGKGGRHSEPTHIKVLRDCADICRTSADFMIRESAYHASVCGTCAEICDACAESCEKIGNDEMMQIGIDAARRSAHGCRKMASH